MNGDSIRRLREDLYPIAPGLVERLIRNIYQDAYQRGILTIRARHIATISALIALGGSYLFRVMPRTGMDLPERTGKKF